MTGTTLSRRYRYYQCTHARKMAARPPTCDAKYVRAEPLEGNVWDAVKQTLEHPEVVITEVRRRQADLMPYAEDSLKRVNRELSTLAQEERRMLKLFRVGKINEEYVEEEIKDIRRKQSAIQNEKREIDANRRVLESLDDAESQLAQVCALVEDNLKSLDYSGKREALDAIGAKVMVIPIEIPLAA